MKKTTSLLLAMLLCICAHAQVFMGISVSGTLTEFTSKLKTKGFVVDPKGTEGHFVFMDGQLNGQTVQLIIIGTPTTLLTKKIVVFYPEASSWLSLNRNYTDVVAIITQKYGKPDTEYTYFTSPYELGDGYELTGVSVEKCFFIAVWQPNTTYPNQTLAVRINKHKQVTLGYENNAMMQKAEAEQKVIDDNTY